MKPIEQLKKDVGRWAMPGCLIPVPLGTKFGDEGQDGWMFQINALRVIASWGGGWDHVSVSMHSRCPTWEEMHWIKKLFFLPDEVVVQYHPAESRYVNTHGFCLHLWRPQDQKIPTPPVEFV